MSGMDFTCAAPAKGQGEYYGVLTVAAYLRISDEDEDRGQAAKTESDSIANQRNLITDFISRMPEFDGAEVIEFCDDGWSGKNFTRPAVRKMLDMARQGKIHCIVVKDLSRFGRDYLEVGNYISRVFPFLGIRFIVVNDGFDSIRPMEADSLETSFKTLIYDIYSRDISRKVRSAKRIKAEKGEFLSPFAPYGYKKDGEKKNHLVIDPETAGIVRKIFEMAADGQTTEKIARTLNMDQVSTPMLQKHSAGCTRKWKSIHEENFWTHNTVGVILRDERNTGMNIFGKRMRDEIGRSHTVKKDRGEWISVSGTHQGIVTREEFDRAQEQMRRFQERGCGKPGGSPFLKKVRCGICGHIMARAGKKKPYYVCHTPRVTDKYACPVERMPEKDFEEAVLKQLRIQALYAVDLSRIWEEKQRLRKQDTEGMRKALSRLKESRSALDNHIRDIYEKTIFGEMDKEAYLKEKKLASEEKDQINQRIRELEAELQNASENGRLENKFTDSFQQYTEIEELTADIVNDVLQEIVVFPDRVFNIVWNYRDELESLLLDVNTKKQAENSEN